MAAGSMKKLTALAAGTTFALALAGSPGDARAQTTPASSGPVGVTTTGKGIVGGALLGAEVVCIPMGAAGVHAIWPYAVFCPLGAGGGAVGGFFVEKMSAPEPSLYMLAGGLALIIPMLVVTINATRYQIPEGERTDTTTNEPAPASPKPAAPPVTSRREMPHIPLSFVDVYKSKVALGIPALELRPLYTQQELFQYGVSQGAEVRVPVFKTSF